jgi:predicted phage tail protein
MTSTEDREVTAEPNVVGFLMTLYQLVIGLVTIAFAVFDDFAEGNVAFDHERWRYAFGALGLYLSFRAARGMVRMLARSKLTLSEEKHRDARRHGLTQQLRGAGFLLIAWSDALAERSVAFLSWTEPFYVTAGLFMVLMGTLHWINPQNALRAVRMREQLMERASKASSGE